MPGILHFLLMISVKDQVKKGDVSSDPIEFSKWVWPSLFVLVAIGLSVFYLLHYFRGLPASEAMDQAQIGREILRGHGWQTRFIRPLAIGELRRHGKDVATTIQYDTYNAPIPPLLDAAALYIPIHAGWDFTKSDMIYPGDRAIACMGVIFFLASLFVLYRVALELFDQRLAFMTAGLVLICDVMWRYSLSGLPQMFLLLLFHLNAYAIVRAIRARYLNEPHLGWIAADGVWLRPHGPHPCALDLHLFPRLLFSCSSFPARGRRRVYHAGGIPGGLHAVAGPQCDGVRRLPGNGRLSRGSTASSIPSRATCGGLRFDLGASPVNYFFANLPGQSDRPDRSAHRIHGLEPGGSPCVSSACSMRSGIQ